MFLARIGWRRCGRPTGPDRAAELVATATSFSTPWGRSESRLQATGGSVLWLAWAVCYITAMGRMRLPFFHVDDLLWITQSSDGLLRILASILLLSVLGVPFAWHKFSGGGEHTWIGYSLCVAKRTVGISLSRADWVIGWIRKTRSDGLVRVGDLRSVLGRLSFAFSVIPLLKPFLGPINAWAAAVQACRTLRLPKAVSLVLLFLQRALEQGLRRVEVPRHSTAPKEHFRTDAKAQVPSSGWGAGAVLTMRILATAGGFRRRLII